MNGSKGKERWIHCYKSSQKILLVGEGDFSFAACLARAFCSAENIVATSYLDRNSLLQIHWTSIPHLDDLERLGCLLLYEVDVYKMNTHPILKNMKFDIIVFNFPHAGHFHYLRERDPELMGMHMDLVEAYFRSASKMLTKGGEVHLRHRDDPPYDTWNVVSLAGKAGLTLKEKEDFAKSDYPGYHNKRGGGINTNKSFPIICAYTFKFVPYLLEVVDHHHYDLNKKDEVNHVLEMNNQVLKCDKVNNKFQNEEVDLLENDDAHDNRFVQKNDVVVDEHDLHVLEMLDVCEHGTKNHKLDNHHVLKIIDDGHLLKKDEVINVDLDLRMVDDDLDDDLDFPNNDDGDQNLSKKDYEVHALLMEDQDHDHLNNEEVQDHSLKGEEMDSDLLKKDEVLNKRPNNNEVCDDLPNNERVNDTYLLRNDGVNNNLDLYCLKNDEVDHDLDIYVKEMNDEMGKAHGESYACVLEMMDHLNLLQIEQKGYPVIIPDKDHGYDDNKDVKETKDNNHEQFAETDAVQDGRIEGKKEGVDGYHHNRHPNKDADLIEIKGDVYVDDCDAMNKMKEPAMFYAA